MSDSQAKLARKSLDKILNPLRDERIVTPPRGWTKAIRESLGMTTRQLAGLLHDQAARKVRNELVHLNHTMRLENQAVTPDDLNGEERRLIGVYLTTLNRRLWDTE